MNKVVIRTMALLAMAVPGMAAAQEYSDPTAYVVDPINEPARVYAQDQMVDDREPWKTTVVPFYPEYYGYPQTMKDAVVSDEQRITNGALKVDGMTGEPLLDFDQATIPEATNPNVLPPTQTQPTNNTATVFQKTFNRTEHFGNTKIVAAGYNINASITATTATSSTAKKVEALGEGKVIGSAFSFQKEIVRGRVYISGQQGGANNGTAAVYVMGNQIWGTSLYATFNPAPWSWSRTFFSANKTFWIGPVPVNVKLSLSGGAKLTANGQIGPTVAKLTAKPGGWADATGSASISVKVAAVGVDVSLKVIDATLPSYGELYWPYCSLNWKLTSNLVLTNTLSGQIKAWVKIKMLFFKKTWRVTIAKWSGFNKNYSLLNIYGTKNLGTC